MRLHRLTLRDVKGVLDRTVDFPDHGVLVIEGPNEVGKTTLLDGFDALLSLKSTSKAKAVHALQPVDRDVAPFVEAELSIGGQRLRYAKRWLKAPSTTLHVLGDRPEQLTGDLAQQRFDGLLEQHLDRTLWDALRLTQSGDGSVAPLISSSVLTAALDAAAGAHQHAEGADALLDRVAEEQARYFTPTGRPTGVYREAMARHTEAQLAVAEAHRRVQEGAALLERQEQAREEAAEVGAAAARAAQRRAAAEQAGAEADAVAATHAAALERLGHAQDRHREAGRSQQRREQLVAQRAGLVDELAEARRARQADLEAADGLTEELLAAEGAVQDATTLLDEATDEVAAARADADHLSDVRELRSREQLAQHAAELVDAVRQAQEAMPQQVVEREVARRVRAQQDRMDAMVIHHATATPVLEVEALGAAVEVGPERQQVETGQRLEVQVAHDTEVRVPGQVRIRVRLHEEAQGRATEIDRLRAELRSTLDGLGCAGVDDVDALAEATELARARVREATRDVEAMLRPWGASLAAEAAAGVLPTALADEVARAREQVARSQEGRAPGRALPADEPAARAAVQQAESHLRHARLAHREAMEELGRCRRRVAALTSRLDQAEGHIGAQTARVEALDAQLASAREETDDEALAEQVGRCAQQVATAARAVEEAAAAVAASDITRVRAELRSARDQHQELSGAHDRARAALHHLKGQVEMAAGEGRQEIYDLALADLDDAGRELRAVDRRARAARHLFTTLNKHRDNAHRAYVRPYTQALETLGRRVYGEDFAVTVDEDLALSARTLGGATVPFTELSGGAKEQLGILARLAVARLVDPTQGVPVVIDDALGYSDPQRLHQMGEVLGASADADAEVQVILLTCTPERYASIPDVHTVRLTA